MQMVTQDGVLNLQAKNLQQKPNGETSDTSFENGIDFNSIFLKVSARDLGRFSNIIRLNLSSNKIFNINADFCKSLCNVQVLDLRANRIREISPHIKAMSSLRVLKLDKNELAWLPEELFDIKILEELTL